MGSFTRTYTATGTEAKPGLIFSAGIQYWSGVFTITVSVDGAGTDIYNLIYRLGRLGDGALCFSSGVTMHQFGLSYSESWTVGVTGGTWSCTNWDTLEIFHSGTTDRVPAGRVITVTFSGAGIADEIFTPCQHGTQLNGLADGFIEITAGTVLALVLPGPTKMLAPAFDPLVGQYIDLDWLCGSGPPPMPDVPFPEFLKHTYLAQQAFNHFAWYVWCECAPGSPAPIPYDGPSTALPTGSPLYRTYPCDNADTCAALARIERQLAAMTRQLGMNLDLTTLMQRYTLPMAYMTGSGHMSLSGSGSFAVSRLLGVRVDIVSELTGRQLEGTPPYIWDLGWMSIMTPDGMIEEKRITRDTQIWQPTLMPEASTFGYFFKAGVVANVHELLAEQ